MTHIQRDPIDSNDAPPSNAAPVGIGIDLGTTKSCLAVARYDAETGAEVCELIDFTGAPGCRGPALPSAVAWVEGAHRFGDDALRLRGRPGIRTERELFYETKNLMGLRYTFFGAPEDMQSPTDIAAAVLWKLWALTTERIELPAEAPIVITVPASFQGAQRRATVEAARRALGDSRVIRLLDEPCAAFLDLMQRDSPGLVRLPDRSRLLVFDFGGGTCDVAIFQLECRANDPLSARLLGSSRYHRLGGGDIDRAIVHDHLLPRLLEDNGLKRLDVLWGDKRRVLEPQLLGVAESLKLALSGQMARAIGTPSAGHAVATYGPVEVLYQGRHLTLRVPTLTEAEFCKLLQPFLDRDPPPEAGDEYVQRSSIFAPIVQALSRAHLEAEDIDAVLLCGSSSLLPPVRAAIAQCFPDATQLIAKDFDTLQGTVARGGARQALSLAANGQPLIATVCSTDLHLRVADGLVPLAHAGDAVPATSQDAISLRPPADSPQHAVPLAVELVADGGRVVGRSLWMLPPPVRRDEPLDLHWRLDEDQCAELHLNRPGHDGTDPFKQRFEAPVLHRDAGQHTRVRLLEREEAFRRDEIPRDALGSALEDHARDCGALGEYEKALFAVSKAMQEKGATGQLLNLRGLYRQRLGDMDGAGASYLEAGEFGPARFNLALLHYKQGDYEQALDAILQAMEMESDRPCQALRGDVLQKLGRNEEARLAWQDAVAGKLDLKHCDGWELGWLKSAASSLDDKRLLTRVGKALQTVDARSVASERQGVLPERAE